MTRLTDLRSRATFSEGEYHAWPKNRWGVELEVGDFLWGLVRLLRPALVLESGTGNAISTRFLAAACAENGHGRVITFEPDEKFVPDARQRLRGLPAEVRSGDTIAWNGDTPALVFIDSFPTERRIAEIERWTRTPGVLVLVHDASRYGSSVLPDTGFRFPTPRGLWMGFGSGPVVDSPHVPVSKQGQVELIVTGTGRCGTRYMSELLTRAGVPCGHEAVFTPEGIMPANGLRADSSWLAVPYLLTQDATKIVHLVRHPRLVAESFLSIGFFSRDLTSPHRAFAAGHFDRSGDELRDALRWVVEWNEWAERHAYERIRIEDMPDQQWLASVGATQKCDPPSPTTNHRTRHEVDWPDGSELEAAKALAARYGYDW